MKKYFFYLLFLGIIVVSCKKDDDPVVEEEVTDDEVAEEVDIQVQDFMWQTLNAYYYWQGDVPVLADDRFATQTAYESYLATILTQKIF